MRRFLRQLVRHVLGLLGIRWLVGSVFAFVRDHAAADAHTLAVLVGTETPLRGNPLFGLLVAQVTPQLTDLGLEAFALASMIAVGVFFLVYLGIYSRHLAMDLRGFVSGGDRVGRWVAGRALAFHLLMLAGVVWLLTPAIRFDARLAVYAELVRASAPASVRDLMAPHRLGLAAYSYEMWLVAYFLLLAFFATVVSRSWNGMCDVLWQVTRRERPDVGNA
jgi:hypothetical protein